MKFLVKTAVFVMLFLATIQPNAFCAEDNHIILLAGLSKPPFIFVENDKGMQIEIIQAALDKYHYQISFFYLPMTRHIEVYKKRNIEGLITLSTTENELGLYLSKPYISYRNVVVTLADNNVNITKISDLSDMRVAGFQNALKFLGKEYNNIFKESNSYVELADQKSQVALLFTQRVDALVIDIDIFKYLLTLMKKEGLSKNIYNAEFVVHPLFGNIDYVAGFSNQQLQKDFDNGISEIKANGNYQKIIDSYLKPQTQN
ncbi:transporter substrate-binding domain-containing protein [Colwellia sp. 4_MG-2023]|uniref:substrate-binding periplasmic protein n=1 Tax=unclassified Colwellia TaxID=196834 RepID=UPI0026E423BF|nr:MULTISPECIES: transporter substrate-binding domain-containing protein [unclassified Colwellia]MDO6505627.1 transporter substrate-binding domain-containing protein [Colwellia sp. 5_MG-2023]MDO6554077.1 transporter substrate-binding domain-containing protein [Colwellia sp. 4_MG-2023]